ncbi:MAG TPA: hypothetical protein VG323_21805 [Thermoanaerobaculia bacterium]|nr:hypothetical protein [Thermoanaerobaculia bacterium]
MARHVPTFMKSLFLPALFLAGTAIAQPYVSPILERPTLSTRAAPAMALAPDGDGFIAAWSAGAGPSRIYVARFGSSFEPRSPVREIPALEGEAYDAVYPDVARIDGGYGLVWLERERIAQPRVAIVILTRLSLDLAPSPATIVSPISDGSVARTAGGDAHAVSVLAQGSFVTIDTNGATPSEPLGG